MITHKIKEFVETIGIGLVASADKTGAPHIAAGAALKVRDSSSLSFDNWFCETTLQNVKENPKVAVAVTSPDLQEGFVFIGTMIRMFDEAIMDGLAPEADKPDMPQALVGMIVHVENVTEFWAGVHRDLPVA